MKRLLLDTSAYFAFMRGHREAGYAIGDAEEIYLNVVVMGEVFDAFLRGSKREQNQADFDRFVDSPHVNIIEIDEITAERYAFISDTLRRAGTPISPNDLWIAASALQHGLEILTFDSDFKKVPQVI
ncbi:MAG TPA: type II toxin-antitoxin system VapC family toxin, partial [Thermoanaerobaculia bacterium]|nr:type II toxin-antitoxin system VapC family toxin [Thermoanaerobaculia bacterium]